MCLGTASTMLKVLQFRYYIRVCCSKYTRPPCEKTVFCRYSTVPNRFCGASHRLTQSSREHPFWRRFITKEKIYISPDFAWTCNKCGLQCSDCVNSGNNQECYELIGILIPNPLILLALVLCSCKYFEQWTLTLLRVAKNSRLYIYGSPVEYCFSTWQTWGIRFLFLFKKKKKKTSINVCIAASQENLLRFNNQSTSPFRVPMFIYFGYPVMWRTLGRGQIMSTAGMCPLSTLHGGGFYSTWPQDGSKDRRGLMCENTFFILAAKTCEFY